MTSQIIRLPIDIFSVVHAHHKALLAALQPDTFDVTAAASHAPTSVAIWIRRYAFIPHTPAEFLVPALVIAPEGSSFDFWPRPLPDAEARRMLDTIEPALTSLKAVTGHQGLEIGEAFERARSEPTIGPRPVAPLPAGSAWQQRLLAKAQNLTQELQSELGALDNKLASYQARNQAADMDRVIARLDAHAHLGQRLTVRNRADGRLVAGLSTESRRGSLAEVMNAAQSHEQATLHAHQYFNPFGYPPNPDIGTLVWLNRLVRGVVRKVNAHEFRTDDLRASELARNLTFPLRIPAEAVPQALETWLEDMQPGRWPGVHPIIQATFALVELVSVRPFQTGNGRLARILFAEALRTRGLPVLAWNTAIERHFDAYQGALGTALNAGAYKQVVIFMLEACEDAIFHADRIIDIGVAERRRLTMTLEHRTLDGVEIGEKTAYSLAEDLIGGVLVEGFTPRLEFVPMRSLLGDLARQGYLELIMTPHGLWASLPAIRRLFVP